MCGHKLLHKEEKQTASWVSLSDAAFFFLGGIIGVKYDANSQRLICSPKNRITGVAGRPNSV